MTCPYCGTENGGGICCLSAVVEKKWEARDGAAAAFPDELDRAVSCLDILGNGIYQGTIPAEKISGPCSIRFEIFLDPIEGLMIQFPGEKPQKFELSEE